MKWLAVGATVLFTTLAFVYLIAGIRVVVDGRAVIGLVFFANTVGFGYIAHTIFRKQLL